MQLAGYKVKCMLAEPKGKRSHMDSSWSDPASPLSQQVLSPTILQALPLQCTVALQTPHNAPKHGVNVFSSARNAFVSHFCLASLSCHQSVNNTACCACSVVGMCMQSTRMEQQHHHLGYSNGAAMSPVGAGTHSPLNTRLLTQHVDL